MHVPKPVIVVVFAALGVLGIGVAAATVDPGGDEAVLVPDEPTTAPTTAPSTTAPPTTAPPTTDPPSTAPVVPPDDGEGDDGEGHALERYYGPECGEQIPDGTHGDYVSRAAHDPEGDVTAVAHSNCGKPLSSVHDAPPAADPTEGEGADDGHPQGGPPGQTKDKSKPKKD